MKYLMIAITAILLMAIFSPVQSETIIHEYQDGSHTTIYYSSDGYSTTYNSIHVSADQKKKSFEGSYYSFLGDNKEKVMLSLMSGEERVAYLKKKNEDYARIMTIQPIEDYPCVALCSK